jgi:Pyruvate/2-oxoacid:ferredoxin oxidoreductase delta subunit
MAEDIYRKIQEQLDRYSLGFPATESGIELKILKKLFREEDAELFSRMTQRLETPEQIAKRLDKPVEEIAARLADMTERGLLFRLKRGDSSKYAAIPFVHGLFEFQLKNLDRELAEMMEQYHKEGFSTNFHKIGGMFLRTIPVQRSVDITHHVAAYDDAVEILKSRDPIVVAECICRKRKQVMSSGCDKRLEACFMFGSMGQLYVDRGMGRQVDLDEAISILKEAQESGLVTQPATTQNPTGMCNCCGDCCGVLISIKEHPKPAQLVCSNYYAMSDREICAGCETCLERCQMAAIQIDEDNKAVVNRDRCIGCGLCVMTCSAEAMRLVPKPETERMTPPATPAEQMMLMAKNRGLL